MCICFLHMVASVHGGEDTGAAASEAREDGGGGDGIRASGLCPAVIYPGKDMVLGDDDALHMSFVVQECGSSAGDGSLVGERVSAVCSAPRACV